MHKFARLLRSRSGLRRTWELTARDLIVNGHAVKMNPPGLKVLNAETWSAIGNVVTDSVMIGDAETSMSVTADEEHSHAEVL